jgi:hypothetical protein
MGMRYKVWLRYGTKGQDTRDMFREVEALSEGHALSLVQSMAKDYSRTFDSNVTSPIQEEETDFHWDYKLLRAKAREVLTELEYETLQNALMLACKYYTRDRKEATMKLGRIFHD